MGRPARIGIAIAAALVAAAALFVALRPAPIPVEYAVAAPGPLRVTIDEQGEARAHDRYVVAAPVAGRVARVELHEGDPVAVGDVVAIVHAAPLSAQDREAQLARIDAAQAVVREAEDNVHKSRTVLAQAKRERERTERLVAEKFVSPQALERARDLEVTAQADLDGAMARVRATTALLAAARAVLTAAAPGAEDRPIGLHAPAAGQVLRILEKSERVVAAGTPLVVIGDPQKLEIVVDLLSTDAVRVRPGMVATIENWGGGGALAARVRTVEPAAFTKVSALGVEEQRVNVVLDLADPPRALGDGFRVDVRILEAEAPATLKLPGSAVFRAGPGDAVFVVLGGRAKRQPVDIGLRNRDEVEIRAGVDPGAQVVRFPSSALADGVRVREVR